MAKKIDVTVLVGTVDDGDEKYGPGKSLQVDEGEAKGLVDAGIVRLGVPDEPDEGMTDERLDLLLEAIGALEDGNENHWTEKGLPEVAALKELTGGNVTGDERDEAWLEYQANS